jgi:acyl-CoA thioester hydrolase
MGRNMSGIRSLSAVVRIRIPYQDADPGGVVWHGNYFRYFDAARVALLDKIDFGYRAMEQSGFGWPIIDAHVRFIQAAVYDQEIEVEAWLVESEYRLKIEYEVRDLEGVRLTKGMTIQVAVDLVTRELQLGTPDVLLDKLAAMGIQDFGKAGS